MASRLLRPSKQLVPVIVAGGVVYGPYVTTPCITVPFFRVAVLSVAERAIVGLPVLVVVFVWLLVRLPDSLALLSTATNYTRFPWFVVSVWVRLVSLPAVAVVVWPLQLPHHGRFGIWATGALWAFLSVALSLPGMASGVSALFHRAYGAAVSYCLVAVSLTLVFTADKLPAARGLFMARLAGTGRAVRSLGVGLLLVGVVLPQ